MIIKEKILNFLKKIKKYDKDINICTIESYLPLLIYLITEIKNIENTIFISNNKDIINLVKNYKYIYLDNDKMNNENYIEEKNVEFLEKTKNFNINFFGSNHTNTYLFFQKYVKKIVILDDGLSLYKKSTYPYSKLVKNKKINKIKLLGFLEIPKKIKKKVEIIKLNEIYGKLDILYKNKILEIFNFSEQDIKRIRNNEIIFFTQPLSEDKILTLEEEIELYEKLLKNYRNKKILIKTHPRENKNYKEIFENKYNLDIFDKKIPIEIFSMLDVQFEIALTLFSTAILSVNANEKIFIGTKVHEKFLESFGEINL